MFKNNIFSLHIHTRKFMTKKTGIGVAKFGCQHFTLGEEKMNLKKVYIKLLLKNLYPPHSNKKIFSHFKNKIVNV